MLTASFIQIEKHLEGDSIGSWRATSLTVLEGCHELVLTRELVAQFLDVCDSLLWMKTGGYTWEGGWVG